MRDPYRVLGIERGASAESIRKAYKTLARRWHPDVSPEPDATQRFQEINAAYATLGDPGRRRLYDEYGEASRRSGFDEARARTVRGFSRAAEVDDLLSSLFGGRAGRRGQDVPRSSGRRSPRGLDQQVELGVDFLDTVLGRTRTITLERPDGHRERLDVPIPAGARDGGRVRLRGRGLAPEGGGPCGDLLVKLQVRPHPVLVRDGDDLELEVPITVLEAMRGGAITVPTPTGDIRLTVAPGSTHGTRLRVRGRGVQREGRPGDLFVVLRPMVPASDDPEVLAAAERIEQAYPTDPRASLKL